MVAERTPPQRTDRTQRIQLNTEDLFTPSIHSCARCLGTILVLAPDKRTALEQILPTENLPVRLTNGSYRQKSLLAALHARLGVWVSFETLVTLLWDGVATAHTITVTISRLNGSLRGTGWRVVRNNNTCRLVHLGEAMSHG